MSKNGGRDNAYTTYESTGYHQTVAPDRLELVMRMEADRMAGLRITEKELIPERQVVLEERRMRTDNVPGALLDEAVQRAAVRPAQALRHADQRLCRGRQEAHRQRPDGVLSKFYAPNNAVLIVAGDTTAEQVRKLAEKHYGPVAVRKVEPRRRPDAGAPDLPQRVIRADARVAEPRWSRHYLAPSYRKGETQYAYALQVLARLLGGGETSRLWRALVVDRKLALSAWASYSPTALGLTTFDLGVHPAPTTPMAEVESAVGSQLGKLIDDGVAAEEVERAQNQLLAAAIYSQDSLASGPRTYGCDALHRRHHCRHRRLAAAHRRRHAGRRDRRRAPCLAARRPGDVHADAAGRQPMTLLPSPARSARRGDALVARRRRCRRHQGGDHAARAQGVAGRRTRARRRCRSPSPLPAVRRPIPPASRASPTSWPRC